MKQKSPMLERISKDAFERALAFAKESLKVNPDVFEHYVRKGIKRAPELRFHPRKGSHSEYFPLVQVVHGLFGASNFSQSLRHLRVIEIIGDRSSFYAYDFLHTIGISVVGSKKKILGHLLHEYTHVAELSNPFTRLYYEIIPFQLTQYQADDLIATLNTEILRYYNPSELSLCPAWLWRYNKLLHSFVSAERTSTAVELAFTNPELLKAFYQIRNLNGNPLDEIEKKFGWEGIFPELDRELINHYVRELNWIREFLQKEILPRIKRKALFGFFVPRDPYPFSIRQIRDFSLFNGWHFYP